MPPPLPDPPDVQQWIVSVRSRVLVSKSRSMPENQGSESMNAEMESTLQTAD